MTSGREILICPGCRTWSAERIDVRTLERVGEVLACACGRRYPVVDGVPIVIPAEQLRAELAMVERDLDPDVAALLAVGGPDDAPYPRLLEHLSIYLDAQWGDRAAPPVEFGLAALVERLAALPDVELAVELGCSVGRGLAELARHADLVVGLDLQLAAVRRARRLLGGERLSYARRLAGRHYGPATIDPRASVPGEALAPDRVMLVCADALDPPLVPRMFDRVVALNLLDSVVHPRQLLAVLDGLCAVGGELILTCPYAWQSSVMAETERIGGPDPATDVAALVERGLDSRFEILEQAELPWRLRRDARSDLLYRVHYLRARKLGT
jgi:SAM-dependent methyltransferase